MATIAGTTTPWKSTIKSKNSLTISSGCFCFIKTLTAPWACVCQAHGAPAGVCWQGYVELHKRGRLPRETGRVIIKNYRLITGWNGRS